MCNLANVQKKASRSPYTQVKRNKKKKLSSTCMQILFCFAFISVTSQQKSDVGTFHVFAPTFPSCPACDRDMTLVKHSTIDAVCFRCPSHKGQKISFLAGHHTSLCDFVLQMPSTISWMTFRGISRLSKSITAVNKASIGLKYCFSWLSIKGPINCERGEIWDQ